ncbi:MAG: dihydrofolate synthase [Propionibacteriaceae bacterium]|nr:dihydrofolate synthase [Propionibacteriaceae bacterium]
MSHEPDSHELTVAALTARWPEDQVAKGTARVEALLDLLGSPQNSAPLIHITGTNGKGSTAIIIDALLRAQGLRTGRFSSPHLVDPAERIAIDGQPVSPARFDEIWEQIRPYADIVDAKAADGVPLTFFELITAMAYAAFADAPVDVMVAEVGMGGRWDATNVADAAVAVVTPISLDHVDKLGASTAAIAAEKAGIIKEGSFAVLAGQEGEAAAVLLERCAAVGAVPLREGVDFGLLDRRLAAGGQVVKLTGAAGPAGEFWLPLHGAAMAENAAVAAAAVEAFHGWRGLEPAVLEEGFGAVVAPARTEVVHTGPPIVIDTCHNPAAVAATLATMDEAFAFAPQIAVWASMADKDIDTMLRLLEPAAAVFVATQADSPRSLSAAELAAKAAAVFGDDRVVMAPDLADALDRAVALADAAGPAAGILVAGSVILAGQARHFLAPDKPLSDLG